MITTAELADMRAVQALTLTEAATVKRHTLASDGQGGVSETWATVATVGCRVSPITSNDERLLGGRLVEGVMQRVTLPALTDVRLADRIGVGGREFEVLAVALHSQETARVVVCVERS